MLKKHRHFNQNLFDLFCIIMSFDNITLNIQVTQFWELSELCLLGLNKVWKSCVNWCRITTGKQNSCDLWTSLVCTILSDMYAERTEHPNTDLHKRVFLSDMLLVSLKRPFHIGNLGNLVSHFSITHILSWFSNLTLRIHTITLHFIYNSAWKFQKINNANECLINTHRWGRSWLVACC